MYELMNLDSTYETPTGNKLSGRNLLRSLDYGDGEYAVNVTNGIASEIAKISELKNRFSVEGSNDDVINRINLQITKDIDSNNLKESIFDSIVKMAKFSAINLSDEQALEVPDLYPVWAPNTEYEQNERITYNGQLYKVAQKHTSQDTDGWRPGESGSTALYSAGESGSAALYIAVSIGSSGHDQWKMPTGAQDAYNMDDIVEYNGKLYQSKMDGNTTIPGQSRFWVEYTE